MDENTSFTRCYVKSESWTFCPKLRLQSQVRTFLQWNSKPTFSTESAESSLSKARLWPHMSANPRTKGPLIYLSPRRAPL